MGIYNEIREPQSSDILQYRGKKYKVGSLISSDRTNFYYFIGIRITDNAENKEEKYIFVATKPDKPGFSIVCDIIDKYDFTVIEKQAVISAPDILKYRGKCYEVGSLISSDGKIFYQFVGIRIDDNIDNKEEKYVFMAINPKRPGFSIACEIINKYDFTVIEKKQVQHIFPDMDLRNCGNKTDLFMPDDDHGFFDYMMYEKTSGSGGGNNSGGGGGGGNSGCMAVIVIISVIYIIVKIYGG